MTKLKLTFALGALLVVAIALVLPGQQQNWTTLNNGTAATTQAVGDNSTKLATTAYVDQNQNAPAWARWLGDGSEGAVTSNGTSLTGTHWVSSFTVSSGQICNVFNNQGLLIRSTGTCTIAGTINARGVDDTGNSGSQSGGGGSGGGSGGGAAAGTAGANTNAMPGNSGVGLVGGGTAGGSSGGNGGNGATPLAAGAGSIQTVLEALPAMWGVDGADGAQGGSSGGIKGKGGDSVVLICNSIVGTGGTIDTSGGYGTPPAANSTGAGSSGGGGAVILSAHRITNAPNIFVNGGPVVPVSVPAAMITSGAGCTTLPVLTLTVTTGALTGCTVSTAGAGCVGTPTFVPVGGGDSAGTITPTMSGGAVLSCVASGGTTYTQSTFTTAGTGGSGGNGWTKSFIF